MYATYNLKEIRSIVNQAVEFEMWEKRDNEKNWEVIQDLKVRLFDLFGIEDYIERVGNPELRTDSFYYIDTEGILHKYLITVNRKGMITSYLEEIVDEDEKEELRLEDMFKEYDIGDVAEEFDWGSSVGNEVW